MMPNAHATLHSHPHQSRLEMCVGIRKTASASPARGYGVHGVELIERMDAVVVDVGAGGCVKVWHYGFNFGLSMV